MNNTTRRINPQAARYVSNLQGCIDQVGQLSVTARVIDYAALRLKLNDEIIGQEEALERIVQTVRMNTMSQSRNKPLGSFLLIGPGGVGKTESTKVLGKALGLHYDKIDCSSMSGGADGLASLFGVAPGYHNAGHGTFHRVISANPDGVVFCIDEYEKPIQQWANQSGKGEDAPIATAFYDVLNEGSIASRFDNSKISARKCIMAFTTNLFADPITEALAKAGPLFQDGADPFANPDSNPFDLTKLTRHVDEMKVILHADGKGLPKPLLDRFGMNIIAFRPMDDYAVVQMVPVSIARLVAENEMILDDGGCDDLIVMDIVKRLMPVPNKSGRTIADQVRNVIGGALTNFQYSRMAASQSYSGLHVRLILDEGSGNVIVQPV